jgi:hypothetical protein
VGEVLILPVPDVLSAFYLVPAKLTADAAKELAMTAVAGHVADPVGTVTRKMLEVGAVKITSSPASALPPLPVALQKHMRVPPSIIDAAANASDFVMVHASWPPGWPPIHETVAAGTAAALAAEMRVPVVDMYVPKILAPEDVLSRLPDAEYKVNLADWVQVFQSDEDNGLWMTTKGLGRFGLPELQIRNVPPQLGQPVTLASSGLANRLLDLWLEGIGESGEEPRFATLPALIEVGEADVAAAYMTEPRGGGTVAVRLTSDPELEVGSDSFLTVQPPDDFPGSVGEFLANVCEVLFGEQRQDVRYLRTSDAMADAIRLARASLPAIRDRYIAGDLPPSTRLMVKHHVKSANGGEYPWAFVTSWKDPARVLGSSAGDAVRNGRIRAGHPIVIDSGDIVDWALWTDKEGIIEGGRTNMVALQEGRPYGER